MKYPYVEDGWVWFNDECIVEQFVDVTWANANKKYYMSRGYVFTNTRDIFTVNVDDVSHGSGVKVITKCPICKKQRGMNFNSVTTCNHTKCLSCSSVVNMEGTSYGRLTIIRMDGFNKAGRAMWECQCNCKDKTILTVIGSHLRSGHTKSCGCILKEMIGENSPHWNSDLTDEGRVISRKYPAMAQWGIDVKERDSFTCQICGDDRGGNLESHHLNGHKDFPEERLDLENGVTLCKGCHKEFHAKYIGSYKKTCTREDFIEFCYMFYPNALFIQNFIKSLL